MGQVLGIINGSNRLHMLVELRVQHCKEMYQDSFENYELFLRFQIVQWERYSIFKILPWIVNSGGLILKMYF